MLSNSGDITEKLNSLNDSLTDNANSLLDLDKKMETIRDRYNQQFGAMEAAVAAMKSTETTITNMMEAWKGSSAVIIKKCLEYSLLQKLWL